MDTFPPTGLANAVCRNERRAINPKENAPERSLTMARLIVQQPSLWELYSQFVGSLHPDTLQEMQAMPRVSKKGPQFHLKPLADLMGMKEVISV
jgi:hypothetical protein